MQWPYLIYAAVYFTFYTDDKCPHEDEGAIQLHHVYTNSYTGENEYVLNTNSANIPMYSYIYVG